MTDTKPPNHGDHSADDSKGTSTSHDVKTRDVKAGDIKTGDVEARDLKGQDVDAQDGTSDDASTSPAHDPSGKSAFEAAIEKKKAAGQARSAHLDGGAKVGGATASHKTSRTFRRKSG